MTNKMDGSKNRPRLGRGLSSLISLTDASAAKGEEDSPVETAPVALPADLPQVSPNSKEPVMRSIGQKGGSIESVVSPELVQASGVPMLIPLSAISPNPLQPRRQFDELAMKELADSIKSNGVIQPIVVKQVGPGQFELIAGERRWRACGLAGKTDIPAVLKDVDRLDQAQMALVENIQRQDLNPIERAQAYRSLIAELGLTQVELALRIGQDKATLSHHLRLLELPAGAQSLIAQGLLSMSHAKAILGVADAAQQERLAKLVVSQQLSLKNLERIIAQLNQDPLNQERGSSPQKPAKTHAAHYAELEQQLTRHLGLRVQINAGTKQGTGKLVLTYTSLDEFDALIQKLGVNIEQ